METPICDFTRNYVRREPMRLHMPGHKGRGPLGFEALDITEFDGADSLYEAAGIIRQSEENASALFGCPTLYSAEGSSLCIRAMLYLCMLRARELGRPLRIAAGRNAHKTFLSAAALLDFDVSWLYPAEDSSYLSCALDADALERQLSAMEEAPLAVYLTTPDYLGNTVDVQAVSRVCRRYGCLLLVDNAHGAYLRFLPRSLHPMDLGADLCCDSAHKTLPVITGGAYLHISPTAPELFHRRAKDALAMFGSTSPSYLILQSLDAANPYLQDVYPPLLAEFLPAVTTLKDALQKHGYTLLGDEALKLSLFTKPYGYTGTDFARLLADEDIICEFYDPDYTVMMLTPELGTATLQRLQAVLAAIARKAPIQSRAPGIRRVQQVLRIREAALAPCELIPVQEAPGRIYAGIGITCPPAVPPVVCGERIDEHTVEQLRYYGIESCPVIL